MKKPEILFVHDFPCQTGGGGEVNAGVIARTLREGYVLNLASIGARDTGLASEYTHYTELKGKLVDSATIQRVAKTANGTIFTSNNFLTLGILTELSMHHQRFPLLWQSSPVSKWKDLKSVAIDTKSRILARLATKNLTFSQVGMEQLRVRGVPDENIVLLPQILHEESGHDLRNPQLRAEFVGENVDLAVLINARVTARKGLAGWVPDMMRHLIPQLEESRKRVQLGLVGNDPETEESRSILTTLNDMGRKSTNLRFVYHGYNPEQMPFRLMQAYDMLVHPSHLEGHSLAAVEALACGLPLMVREECKSNVGIVDSSKAGYVVESPQDAALQLASLCRDLGPLEGLRLRGYEYIKNHTGAGPFKDAFIPAVLGHK